MGAIYTVQIFYDPQIVKREHLLPIYRATGMVAPDDERLLGSGERLTSPSGRKGLPVKFVVPTPDKQRVQETLGLVMKLPPSSAVFELSSSLG